MNKLDEFGWARIARLGLVQAALGAVVVLTTSTLNRVMIVELSLPALLPGLLVALHYAVQIARPRVGHGSDVGGRRTPWIIGGMGVLALGGALAAVSTAWMASARGAGIALAVLSFMLLGLGVAACGTNLLVLLAKRVAPERRASAATLVWVMMIVGFAVTAGIAGQLLDPYSGRRLVIVATAVSCIAFALTLLAVAGLEGRSRAGLAAASPPVPASAPAVTFRAAFAQVWTEPGARRFTIFVFVSMLAFSAQELILEPFAGLVFGYAPGASTSLSGVQHGGVLVGMLAAALAGRRWRGRTFGSLRAWTMGGCLVSALALGGLALSALVGPAWPFKLNVWVTGVANGAFSIAAIGSMMRLATQGQSGREGMRMGLWGAAQASAFAVGGVVGTGAVDLARALIAAPAPAYAAVFAFEAVLFVVSARLAGGVEQRARPAGRPDRVSPSGAAARAMP
jgi:BCD family chlorophyll transporter-like MFS transporter